jgi:hypothetical protein
VGEFVNGGNSPAIKNDFSDGQVAAEITIHVEQERA